MNFICIPFFLLVHILFYSNPHCLGHSVLVRSPPTIHTIINLFWFFSALTVQPPLTLITSKTALPIENNVKPMHFSKDWWEVWIVGRYCTKSKCPQDWEVTWPYFTWQTEAVLIKKWVNFCLLPQDGSRSWRLKMLECALWTGKNFALRCYYGSLLDFLLNFLLSHH